MVVSKLFQPKYFICGYFIFVRLAFAFAQDQQLDSLQLIINSSTRDSVKVNAYYEMAKLTYVQDARKAIAWAKEGAALAEKAGLLRSMANCLNIVGVCQLIMDDPDESVKTHFSALRIREGLKDTTGTIETLFNIGNVFYRGYDREQALKYYLESKKYADKIQYTKVLGILNNNLGSYYKDNYLDKRKDGDFKLAQDYLLEAIQMKEKSPNDKSLSKSYLALAELYLEADQLDLGETYLQKAISRSEKDRNMETIVNTRIALANLMLKEGSPEEALEQVEYIKQLVSDNEMDYLFANIAADLADIEKAIAERDKSIIGTAKDSVSRAELYLARQKLREELRVKYETEKTELENSNLQLTNKAITEKAERNRFLGIVSAVFTLILIGVLILLIKRTRKLNKAYQQIRDQSQLLEEKNKSLEEASKFKSQLFSVVSHDLRAPISTLQSILDIAKIVDLNPNDLKNMLKEVSIDVALTAELLNELLVWSSGQMGKDELLPEEINVFKLVEESKRFFKRQLEIKHISLENSLPQDVSIYADLRRSEFIIRNIIHNAIKYSFDGQRIEVFLKSKKLYLDLCIQDYGRGMSRQMLDELSDSTGTSSLGTVREKGMGLGLILCKEFAKSMNWNISIESEEGAGSTVRLSIPLANDKNALGHEVLTDKDLVG